MRLLRVTGAAVHSDLIIGYLADQKRRGLRARSLEEYRRRLEAFIAAHEVEDIERWLDQWPCAQTRSSYRSTLVMWYRWMVAHDLCARNIAELTARPRVPVGLPRPVASGDLALAMAIANPVERVLLALGAYAGLRSFEIAALRVEDLDMVGGWLLVADGKGGKARQVPLHIEIVRALNALPLPRSGPVLRLNDGRPMRRSNVGQRISSVFDRVEAPGSAHRLRHWFGTEIARTDFRAARELLGHESFQTTARYAQWHSERGRIAIDSIGVAA